MGRKSVHIVGGGIIGLCSAWYLNQQGFEVTIIDKGDLTDGASHGNAGMVVPSHVIPLASPGMISQGIKWMFNSKSPFYVKPRLDLSLLQWTYKFYKSCNEGHVKKAMPFLFHLNEWSKELYQEFVAHPEFNFNFQKDGLLMLYRTAHQEEEEKELAEKAHHIGLDTQVLNNSQLKELDPHINSEVKGGVYFPGDANLHPNKFVKQLTTVLKKNGVVIQTNTEVVGLEEHGGKVHSIVLEGGQKVAVENLLVAGGAWSAQILKKSGLKIYLQDGKGYSVTFNSLANKPKIPAILTEGKVAVSPIGDELRIGGTLELGGMSTNINQNRLDGIFECLPKYYQEIDIDTEQKKKVWYGYRPCTPDGMPYIGKADTCNNLYVATGHAMMGVSMGPATGKLIAEIISDTKQSMDTSMFRLNRF